MEEGVRGCQEQKGIEDIRVIEEAQDDQDLRYMFKTLVLVEIFN